jgi:hypothetical protein
MQASRLLYVPYRISRLPLAMIDAQLARRLGRRSVVRGLTRTTLVTVDRIAAAVFDEAPLPVD